ncbi:MAG: hypothetical protein R3C68_00460 [Myxococcota bacterium]
MCPADLRRWFAHDPREACDDGNLSNTDACLNSCQIAVCGDGLEWSEHEECDLGGDNDDHGACTKACEESALR